MIVQLNPLSISFPPAAAALHEPNGLLAVGGDLSPERLLCAYQNGIFPWFSENDPILWWSPNPRAIVYPDQLHISRSLAKVFRKQPWQITINNQFTAVINACAQQRADNEGTWITAEMMNAYINLHHQGHAHSIEVWLEEELVGGLYGVSVGKTFCGESMFHTVTNASKIALMQFAKVFYVNGGELIDCQVSNPHLISLGAQELTRERFLVKLHSSQNGTMPEGFWTPKTLKPSAFTAYGSD